ncbi:hypothetical protein JDV02_003266 [Purpureocillium takamizusanense]|uniref:Ribosomal protein S21 n=1 Tax=Purpureocillium takamizusanense TaxID=2060973 RepID=A0A9Q8QAA5_9HYPO|nr:uncharacterized protein JDV02_003266 [Purpureocillium takamizusanense]UNI16869.1 hypothetical protein JDV02_003266 [Purpureocillium takamizusanense]
MDGCAVGKEVVTISKLRCTFVVVSRQLRSNSNRRIAAESIGGPLTKRFAKMAATTRYSSSVLSRVLVSSAHARAFSTSLPMRFSPSGSNRDASSPSPSSSPRPPRVRSNPLIGNYAPATPRQPAPGQTPPVSTKHPRSRKPPASSAEVPPNADMPPPPPPPPPAAAAAETADTSATTPPGKNQHPYTAADNSTPFDFDIASIIANKSAAYGRSLGLGDPLSRPKVHSKAVSGRTVFIKDRITPTSAPTPTIALRVLDRMCREQKVRNKYHSQKFHERKGLKKKRLRSQRWRFRFKAGFKAAVNRVLELKKQGW